MRVSAVAEAAGDLKFKTPFIHKWAPTNKNLPQPQEFLPKQKNIKKMKKRDFNWIYRFIKTKTISCVFFSSFYAHKKKMGVKWVWFLRGNEFSSYSYPHIFHLKKYFERERDQS